MNDTRKLLETQLDVIRIRLREAAPDIMRDFEAVETALRNLSPDLQANEYTSYKYGIDAVVACLKKIERPVTGEIIAKTVVDGGWLKGHWRAEANALESIRYHALKHPEKRKVIKRMGGGENAATALIGLYEWDDSL